MSLPAADMGRGTSGFRYGLVAVLTAAALVGGCGGDDEESATPQETTAEEATGGANVVSGEYRDEVNAVLEPLSEDLQQIGSEADEEASPGDLANGLAEAEATLETGTEDLEALEPPDGLGEPHDRLVEAFETFRGATTDAREAAEEGDQEALLSEYPTASTEFQSEVADVAQQFEDAGLEFGPRSSGE